MSLTAFTAFILGPALDPATLVLRIEFSERKEMGDAAGHSEISAVTSRLKGLNSQGENNPNAHTTAGGELEARSMKRQAGNRSRFRPWGYK